MILERIKSCFSTNEDDYIQMAKKYNKFDGLLALFVALAWLLSIYVAINIYSKLPLRGVGIGNLVITLVMVSLTFILLRLRKQTLSSVGLTTKKIIPSAVTGLVFGIIIFFLRIGFSVRHGESILGAVSVGNVAYSLFFYFILIAFTEELTFRAFMQTRIYAIIKSKFFAVITVGIIFAFLHIVTGPITATVLSNSYNEHVQVFSLNFLTIIYLVLAHILLNLLYRKFNSVVGPVILHGFVNLHFW
jgi:membrane protease YdiL (CAAX protease family)